MSAAIEPGTPVHDDGQEWLGDVELGDLEKSADSAAALRLARAVTAYRSIHTRASHEDALDAIRAELKAAALSFGFADLPEIEAFIAGRPVPVEALHRLENSVERFQATPPGSGLSFLDAARALAAGMRKAADREEDNRSEKDREDERQRELLQVLFASDKAAEILVELLIHSKAQSDCAGDDNYEVEALFKAITIRAARNPAVKGLYVHLVPRTFARLRRLKFSESAGTGGRIRLLEPFEITFERGGTIARITKAARHAFTGGEEVER